MNILKKLILLILLSCNCFAANESFLISAIDRQDISDIIEFFDNNETITLDEARELISKIYAHYTSQYGEEILDDTYFQNLDMYRSVYNYLLKEYGFSTENSFMSNANESPSFLFIKKKKKDDKEHKEIPGSMIIGGAEILAGALVWILPFPGTKQLGGIRWVMESEGHLMV